MYIIILSSFLFVQSLYAITPERCKTQEQISQEQTKKSTQNAHTIDFQNKKNLQQITAMQRKVIYKHLLKSGIKKSIAKQVFNLTFLEKPISSGKAQPESTMTIDVYISKFLKHEIIAKGFFMQYSKELNEAEEKYDVDKEIITALITMESLAGLRKGEINILNALFTLSYTSSRSEFFTAELVAAFQLMENSKYHFTFETNGSWAGAMGYSQFMPSSVLNYAVDGNSDGIVDIINNPVDAIHSAANYLQNAKWQRNEPVLKELTAQEIAKIEICTAINKPYEDGKLLLPEILPNERLFVVYNNYNSIIRWNRSFLFAYTANHIAQNLKK